MFRNIIYYQHCQLRRKLESGQDLRMRTIAALACCWLLLCLALVSGYYFLDGHDFPLPHVPEGLRPAPIPSLLSRFIGLFLLSLTFLPFYIVYGRKRVYDRMIAEMDSLPEAGKQQKLRSGRILFYTWVFGPVLFILAMYLGR